MCETLYCKSGQTSQISGKFCGGLKAALGSKPLKNQNASSLLFRWKKKFKIMSFFLLIKGLTTLGTWEIQIGNAGVFYL